MRDDFSQWAGLRLQVDFTAGGAALPAGVPVDAATTAQGHEWSRAVADQLRAAGHSVREGVDAGEDECGDPVEYDEVLVGVGDYVAVAFFRDLIFCSVDVAADQADRETATRAVRDVARAVREVSGWAPRPGQLDADERLALGIGG